MVPSNGRFKFIWRLENFCFSNLYCNTRLSSPAFQINVPFKSIWKLYMFPNGWGSEKYVGIYLERKQDSGPNQLTALFKIYLIDNDGAHCPDGPYTKRVFGKNEEWGFNEVFRRSDLISSSEYLVNNILTVGCELQVLSLDCDERPFLQHERSSNIVFEDASKVCDAMRLMYKDSLFSDIVLRGSSKRFHVHSSILERRLPELYNEVICLPEKVYKNDHITHKILLYAYTGKIDFRDIGCWNISKILEEYGLMTLEEGILSFNTEFIAHTYFMVNRCHFSWKIKTSLLNNDEEIVSSMIVDDANEISFIAFLTKNEASSWKISIRVESDDEVFVKCRVSLEDENYFSEECENLVEESNNEVHCSASLSLLDGVLRYYHYPVTSVDEHFTLKFDFSYPTSNPSVSSFSRLESHCESTNSESFEDTHSLLRCLESLYTDQAGDIGIKVGNSNKMFRAHKCILSSRSPAFRRMLQHEMLERIRNEITMESPYLEISDDFFADLVDKFLLYIYCGKVIAPNEEFREYLQSLIDMYFVGE